MTDEKKKELFPFFALTYSRQLDPEKYGVAESYEEWSSLLEQNPEDIEKISEAAAQLTEEQWSQIEADYATETAETNPITAKNGAKLNTLKKLRSYKKGKKVTKKCSCGCAMVTKKMNGGKMITKCSCGCKK